MAGAKDVGTAPRSVGTRLPRQRRQCLPNLRGIGVIGPAGCASALLPSTRPDRHAVPLSSAAHRGGQ